MVFIATERKGSESCPMNALLFVTICFLAGPAGGAGVDLIPQPVSVELGKGFFQIDGGTVITVDSASHEVGALLQRYLADDGEIELALRVDSADSHGDNTIALRVGAQREKVGGYQLDVTPAGIEICAAGREGLFYGCQTLRQLLLQPKAEGGGRSPIGAVPSVAIRDFPRFSWRGLMLDCSRTFQSIDYIKKTIDRMAFYKMNVLHLHLTDDQGWRIEISRYPELTRKGARFPEEWNEPASHQGYYSQKEITALVRYAAERNITIVPEIELPGHCLAALACYPDLSCTGGPFEIFPFFKGPGINEDIYCAGREETFHFLEAVLLEIFELFPSLYIHIGGDEAPKARWIACDRCQERIDREGLEDERALQSYFIKRIEKFVNSKGRLIIGWDEILEGGLAPNAAVMSWRGVGGGIAAARAGQDVVMSPTSHCYFDYTYGRIDTRRAYLFEPIPEELDGDEAKHVLGLQANFWSHIDREPEKVDSQLFPRLLSIAERGWSPREVRDWDAFCRRVKVHGEHLDRMGVRAKPMPIGTWTPRQMSEIYAPLTWDVSAAIGAAGGYCVLFEYTHGAHRLGIEKVALLIDGEIAAIDIHRRVTGARHENNRYSLVVDRHTAGRSYEIRAWVRAEGGVDSSGQVFLFKDG